MSDAIHLTAGSYDDFKIIFSSLPSKEGLVLWALQSGTSFSLCGFTKDFKFVVQFGPSGSIPTTFLTDFPDAVNVPDSSPSNWPAQERITVMTLPANAPPQYLPSKQLVAGSDINNIVQQLNSAKTGIVAGTTQTQAGATQLDSAVNTIATVTVAGDGVRLPKGFVGLEVWIVNSDADDVQVYGYGTDTINSVATATGVSQAGTLAIYKCNSVSAAGVANWVQFLSA